MPCTLVRLVQFSKVFVTLSLSSDNYISISQLLTYVNTFLKLFLLFSTLRYTHSPYGIRTRVTAVKRRCLNPLTNGPNFMGTSGLEPPTSRLSGVRSNHLSYAPKPMLGLSFIKEKRVTRIELATTAWKAVVLPLNYTRLDGS